MKQLIAEMQELKGQIPEHIRSLVVRRIARAIYHACPDRQAADPFSQRFIAECRLEAGDPFAPAQIEVERSKLACFIDKWIHVQQYQEQGSDGWKPISPEMNEIRVSMCAELLELGGYDAASFGLV